MSKEAMFGLKTNRHRMSIHIQKNIANQHILVYYEGEK